MRVTRILTAAARIVIIALLALVISLRLFEHRFIYYPRPEITAVPAAAYQDVFFEAADRTRLHGWFVPASSDRVWIVSHGNGGNVGHRAPLADFLHEELGVNVFLYDYRGYGRSAGSPDEAGTYADIRGAYAWVRSQGFAPAGICLLGQSIGSAVVVDFATEAEVGGVILEAPFTSIAAMAQRQVHLPIGWLFRTKYDSLSKIPRVRAPLAIIHSRNDPVTPFAFGMQLFDAATGPKRFFALEGDIHEGAMMALGLERQRELKRFLYAGRANSVQRFPG